MMCDWPSGDHDDTHDDLYVARLAVATVTVLRQFFRAVAVEMFVT